MGTPSIDCRCRPSLLQQFIGTNTIIYYAPKTFTSVGFGNSAAILGTVGIGAVNVIMTFVAIKIIDRVGRKALLLFGNAGMVLSLIVLSVVNRFLKVQQLQDGQPLFV